MCWDIAEESCRVGQATDDNITHAHVTLDIYGYDTHLEYLIFIAFPLQQLLRESA